MNNHPYKNIQNSFRWDRAAVDDIFESPFKINPNDKIMTAGSCFARRVASFLNDINMYFITEDIPSELFEFINSNHLQFIFQEVPFDLKSLKEKYNYGIFTARYDNIYTARQLLQLYLRCINELIPVESIWQREDGRYVDAFRPTINPDGYFTAQEVTVDRDFHLRCVRQAFEQADVFIFTMGLSEVWTSKIDNSVYPICPGTKAGGIFDPEKYFMHNLSVKDTVDDFLLFEQKIREINPNIRIILTVSPTPILATASNTHIITANNYTKSMLRVACTEICSKLKNIVYFPSYELALHGAYQGNSNFESDNRTPKQTVIQDIMNYFMYSFGLSPNEAKKTCQTSFNKTGILTDICDDLLQEN